MASGSSGVGGLPGEDFKVGEALGCFCVGRFFFAFRRRLSRPFPIVALSDLPPATCYLSLPIFSIGQYPNTALPKMNDESTAPKSRLSFDMVRWSPSTK